jgi:hypothetical protein
MGFRLQGFDPRRGAAPLSRPLALLPFGSRIRAVRLEGDLRLQSFCLPGESVPREAETSFAADALLAFCPFRAFSTLGVEPGSRFA